MRKSWLKRWNHTHIFVCPRLCTALWRRHLYKVADLVFEIPAGESFWPNEMHKPIIVGIVLPFLRCSPWQVRSTPKMYSVGRKLRGMWGTSDLDARSVLRELLSQHKHMASMPESMVRKMLYFEGDT